MATRGRSRWCLVAARVAVWFVPFRRLASGLGDTMAESPAEITEAQRATAAKIGWAIRGLGQHLPLMTQCLVQALAATWMLKRRRIPSTLYFGLAKEDRWRTQGPCLGAQRHAGADRGKGAAGIYRGGDLR